MPSCTFSWPSSSGVVDAIKGSLTCSPYGYPQYRHTISLIPGTHDYAVGKVYEGIYHNYPLAVMNFREVSQAFEVTRDKLDQLHGLSNLPWVQDVLRRNAYILEKLQCRIDNNDLYGNKVAVVFLDAFSAYWEEYTGMLAELDEEQLTQAG